MNNKHDRRELWTDFECPICYNDREALLYTKCDHKICEQCKKRMFKESGSNSQIQCPACRRPLKWGEITPQSREEREVENEIRLRDRLKKE